MSGKLEKTPKQVLCADIFAEEEEAEALDNPKNGWVGFTLRDFNRALQSRGAGQSSAERIEGVSLMVRALIEQNAELLLEIARLKKENRALEILLKERG